MQSPRGPGRHVTRAHAFPALLELLDLLLGSVLLPGREIQLGAAFLHIMQEKPGDRSDVTIPRPHSFVGVAIIAGAPEDSFHWQYEAILSRCERLATHAGVRTLREGRC